MRIICLTYDLGLKNGLVHLLLWESRNLVPMELLRIDNPMERDLLLLVERESTVELVIILHHYLLLRETAERLTHVSEISNVVLCVTASLLVTRARVLLSTSLFLFIWW